LSVDVGDEGNKSTALLPTLIPLKRRLPATALHGVTAQKTTISNSILLLNSGYKNERM
jgi:hypothetical protein